jgi:hypothetical protein
LLRQVYHVRHVHLVHWAHLSFIFQDYTPLFG